MFDDTQLDRYSTELDGVGATVKYSTIAQKTLNYIRSNWAILLVIGVVNFLSVIITIQNH